MCICVSKSVVPELFWCADHLKYFSAPRNTNYRFAWETADHLSLPHRPPVIRLWESLYLVHRCECVWVCETNYVRVRVCVFVRERGIWKQEGKKTESVLLVLATLYKLFYRIFLQLLGQSKRSLRQKKRNFPLLKSEKSVPRK